MKVLTPLTGSAGLDVSSANVDTIILGSSGSENSDVNVDNLTVWANATFQNNVTIGSTSADTLIINARTSASAPVTASYFYGDGYGLYNLNITGAAQDLRKLLFYINNGPAETYSQAYLEISPADSVYPTSSIWYTDASKTAKIYEEYYERYSGSATLTQPTPITYKIYAADGTTVLLTATDTINYSGIYVNSVSRSIA